MKALAALLLLACACLPASAQVDDTKEAGSGPPGLAVTKFAWSKERLNWEADPFGGPLENFDQMRRRASNEKRIADAKSGGNQIEVNRAEREARADAANFERMRAQKPARYVFLYKASVRNTGSAAVKELDWDYVFADAATGEELGRRQFTSVAKIAPGKSRELSFTVPTPPTQKISAQALDRKEREGLRESVVLVRVLYEDGTVWERAK
ncbi:MAG TPA: hypothetical protein VGX48_25400 [Pyrinomonadaceae bacterium]|jgi:hypothetical protein|nr:hypothetical protein [Pyrinomonadaceae bacterium]